MNRMFRQSWLLAFKSPGFWVLWFWVFLLPLLTNLHLLQHLPLLQKIIVAAVFLAGTSLVTFFLLLVMTWQPRWHFISRVMLFGIMLHGAISVLFLFSTGRRLSNAELLVFIDEQTFLFWYFLQNQLYVLFGLAVIPLVVWRLAGQTLKFIPKHLQPNSMISAALLPLAVVVTFAGALWAGSLRGDRDRTLAKQDLALPNLELSFRALKGLFPVLEWVEFALPSDIINRRTQGKMGDPIVDTDAYFRANHANLKRGLLRPVLVAQLEAVRADAIYKFINGIEVTPFLNRLAREGLFFRHAYATSSHTNYSALSIPLGLYPLRSRKPFMYHRDDPHPHFMLHDLLKPFGYRTMYFSSQYEPWRGMDQYWKTAALDEYLDSTSHQTAATKTLTYLQSKKLLATNTEDSVTIDAFLKSLQSGGKQDPFLAFLFLENGHFPYPLPKSFAGPFQPAELDSSATFLDVPEAMRPNFKNAYWNSIHYMDRQLERVYVKLADLGLSEETIFIVLADHGEDLFDSGFPTHGTELTDPVVRIPLIVADRKLSRGTIDTPVSQVDVAPIILGMLGLNPFPGHQGVDILKGNHNLPVGRPIFFHANGFRRQDGILAWPWKLLLDVESGEINLYNLEWGEAQGGDQREHWPAIVAELIQRLQEFRDTQLAYYSHADLYERFFPPKPDALGLSWLTPRTDGGKETP
jgi:arylsulfatase A-like enzyme